MRTPKTIYAVNRGALMNASKYWFGIDGIDCTGKTSIAHALQADSEFLRLANATVYDEFTSGHQAKHCAVSLVNIASCR